MTSMPLCHTVSRKVVYADGVFDMLHWGHLRLFERAKEFGDYLLVGVMSDQTTACYKKRPIIPEEQRYALVAALRVVDQIVKDAPMTLSKEFIELHNIAAVVHGNDTMYEESYRVPIEMGIMHYISYTAEISSTQIQQRLLDDNRLRLD